MNAFTFNQPAPVSELMPTPDEVYASLDASLQPFCAAGLGATLYPRGRNHYRLELSNSSGRLWFATTFHPRNLEWLKGELARSLNIYQRLKNCPLLQQA